MKYLKTDPMKCKGVRACEKTCAKTFFKVEDAKKSCIQIQEHEQKCTIKVCNQCGACIDVCPVQAISRNKQGVVTINKSICVGCYICVGFCPTLDMHYHSDLREPFKCVACGACVKTCPEKALELAEK